MPQGMKICCCRWVHFAPDPSLKNLQEAPYIAAYHIPVILWQGTSSRVAQDMDKRAKNTVLLLLL